MASVPAQHMTADEYLANERQARFKSEFLRGEIFAMAGNSRWHGRIATNLLRCADQQLRDEPCDVYGSDMRVKVSPTGLYTYPDCSISCGEAEFEDEVVDTLLNPRVIFEILSKSTEAYDRGKKFDHYRQIASLKEYVIVAQTEPLVELYARQPDASWRLTVHKSMDAVVELESVRCKMWLAEVYRRVDFAKAQEEY
jgi:Uma2 family endonuclease